MGKVGLIVQARMGSTRLPGKTMKEVNGKPLLGYLLDRLLKVPGAPLIVVATSTLEREAPIVAYCQSRGVAIFRGSETDVLDRYLQCAKSYQLDTIVRITADCPLIDPQVITEALSHFQGCDYLSNTLRRTYPQGYDTEIFSLEALEKISRLTQDSYDREHVTPYFYHHPEQFVLKSLEQPIGNPDLRLVIDTQEDFEFVSYLLKKSHIN